MPDTLELPRHLRTLGAVWSKLDGWFDPSILSGVPAVVELLFELQLVVGQHPQVAASWRQTRLRLDVSSIPNPESNRRPHRDSDRGFGGCIIFGCGIGKPQNRQGTALPNQGIDLLNHGIASKAVAGV